MWPKVKPFAMTSAAQFRPQPPIALNSEEWTTDYNEIKELGGRTSTKRSARQTEDARFWLAPGPVIYYPWCASSPPPRSSIWSTARGSWR